MRMSRRRWWGVAAVVVIAIVAAGTALWFVDRAAAAGVSVTVEPAKFVLGKDSFEPMQVKVTNKSGRELTDAELRLAVDNPGGDHRRVEFSDEMFDEECGIEDPGPHPDCEKAEKLAEAQSCKPKPQGDGERRGVVCDGDILKGTGEYSFDYDIGGLPSYEELAAFEGYPDLTIHAEVLVSGQPVADTTQRLSVGMPDGYGRLEVGELPQDMAIDDPASRTHEWSFTVTNDTDTAVTDASIEIALNSGSDLAEIDTSRKGCDRDVGVTAYSEINCSGVDIPAGEKLTVELRMNIADGAATRFEEYCPPGSPTDDKCRKDAGELPLLIDVFTDGTFAYAKDTVTLLVD